jgi:hypothetical protein
VYTTVTIMSSCKSHYYSQFYATSDNPALCAVSHVVAISDGGVVWSTRLTSSGNSFAAVVGLDKTVHLLR